jgi:hypothetical protein
MELITKELEERFKEIGSQNKTEDPIVVIKFFNAAGAGTWFATEYNKKDKIFFGYVSIFGDHNDEWGDFSLEELQSVKGLGGLGIERDLYCGEKRISEFEISSLKVED